MAVSYTHLDVYKRQDKRRPVLINNWEATYFDFNTEKIVKIAEKAASLGVEMMVLDDGWFGTRNDDNQGLGLSLIHILKVCWFWENTHRSRSVSGSKKIGQIIWMSLCYWWFLESC